MLSRYYTIFILKIGSQLDSCYIFDKQDLYVNILSLLIHLKGQGQMPQST